MTENDRIDALQRALEGSDSSSEEIASLVALVRMLEDMPEPEIDPSFAAALEDRLVGPDTAPAPAPAPASLATITRIEDRRRRRVRRGLVAAIAAAMMLALPVAASASAVPGHAGYGIRLAREEARLWMQCRAGAVKCGFAHLDRAEARMADLRGVIRRGDVDQVPPTSARLRRSMATGATTILSARPPATTLRRLAKRLDDAAVTLNAIAAAAPPDLRPSIRAALGEGESLTHDVLVALGEVPRPPVARPPVAIGPPPSEPPAAPAEQPRPAKTSREPAKKPAGNGNSFGPGGTPVIAKPAPGEQWHGDEPLRDDCPLGVVAAPGVDGLCDAARSGG